MRKNALPGLALWLLALLLILADRTIPAAHATFQSVGTWKDRYGLVFSATTTSFFGGAVPFLLLLATGRTRRDRLAVELAFYLLFWAYKGVEVDLFYRLQSRFFGDQRSREPSYARCWSTSSFTTPSGAAPVSALAFLWKESAFSWKTVRSQLGFALMTFTVPVTLMSTWAVWIPAVAVIYCLPAALQIPLFNIVLCFWVLVLTFISKRPARDSASGDPTCPSLPSSRSTDSCGAC